MNNNSQVDTYAKINLSIDVLNKRADGYHNVRMIMQTISLMDSIYIEKTQSGIEILCSTPGVPLDKRNTAYKSANLLIEKFGINEGVRINILKRIPVAAGLAGGSTDAAAILKELNKLFDLRLGINELMDLGKEIGADVPYCILGGTALSEGIGEILTSIECSKKIDIVLIKPKFEVSTAWVYNNLDLNNLGDIPDTELLINALSEGNIDCLSQNMRNVLESVTLKKHPEILEIKNLLIKLGAIGSMMSGSGPTVFGIFRNRETAEDAFSSLGNLNINNKYDYFIAETLDNN